MSNPSFRFGEHLVGHRADTLYIEALRSLNKAPIQEGRGEPTKELLFATFELIEPRNRLVSIRDINPAFAFVEVLWICAGGNNVKYLEFWNKRMRDFADPETGLLHGAYGARLGFQNMWHIGKSQFDPKVNNVLYISDDYGSHSSVGTRCQPYFAYNTLDSKPNSRQVTLQIWNSATDLPMTDGEERSADVPCNLLSHLLLRDDKLYWLQVMRSNDAVWGWPYNIIQWTFLQEFMAGWLGVGLGTFSLVSDSFHTYKKHWANIPKIIDRYHRQNGLGVAGPASHTNTYNLPFDEWKTSMLGMIEGAYHLTQCRFGDERDYVLSLFNRIDLRFIGLMGMLAAEATRIKVARLPVTETERETLVERALELARDLVMVNDPYWYWAWRRWAEAKYLGVIL